MLVPRALHIDGVAFPLEVSPGGVRLALAVPALEAPQLVLAQLCNAGVPPERRELFARGEDFVVPNLSAIRMSASAPDARDAVAAWKKLARRDPGADVYVVSASFVNEALAIPATTMARLLAELAPLCDGIRSGAVEPRLADAAAHAGAQAATPATAATVAATVASATASPFAPDDVLGDLEAAAALLDQLDPEDTLREGLPSEELDALTSARRRTVLLGLREAGLFTTAALAPEALGNHRARLLAASLPTLAGYLDAAAALAAYLTSRDRAALLPPASEDLLLAAVSLDWFRKPSPRAAPPPPSSSAATWLARCEAALLGARAAGPRAGRTYAKLDGAGLWLHFRTDLGPHVCLWRALPASR